MTAQLTDARTDTHQWAEHYDRDVSDVFVMQSEIAQATADKLRSNLSIQEKAAVAGRSTVGLKAYELYTKAEAIDPWDTPGGAAPNINLTGECEQAFDQSEALAKTYDGITYGKLRFNPYRDLLRGDPRFETLVASLTPPPGP